MDVNWCLTCSKRTVSTPISAIGMTLTSSSTPATHTALKSAVKGISMSIPHMLQLPARHRYHPLSLYPRTLDDLLFLDLPLPLLWPLLCSNPPTSQSSLPVETEERFHSQLPISSSRPSNAEIVSSFPPLLESRK